MMLGSKRIPGISGWVMWRLLRPISLAMPRSCCWWEKGSCRPTKKEKWDWYVGGHRTSKDRHHKKASIPNNPSPIMSSNDVGSQTSYFWPSKKLPQYLKLLWIFAPNRDFLTISQCLKITQIVAFEFLNFGIFVQFKWPVW